MLGGPINRDNSGKYVGQRVGSSGIDKDTVMLGKPKRSLSEKIGSFYDRCVEVILHPQRTFRERKEFRQAVKDGADYDKQAVQKRIADRTAFSVENQNIAKGLKKVEQNAREQQGLPVGKKEADYEQDRTRAIRLAIDNEEILPPWRHDDQYLAETDTIRSEVKKELEGRKQFNKEMKLVFSEQFAQEDKDISSLKADVARYREVEQKWEDRLGALRWYQNTEKRVHSAFARDENFGKIMTRDEIYVQYEQAFENHRLKRDELARRVEIQGKTHDQKRYPKEQMDFVNEGLKEFKTKVAEQFDKDFNKANPALLLIALKANPNLRTEIYGNIVETSLKKLKKEIEALETSIKNTKGSNPFDFSDEIKKAHTALAAKRIQYGALYRMTMMSKDQEAFEKRITGYLEGEDDPEEVRMVAEAKKHEESSLALLKKRTERPFFWNMTSSHEGTDQTTKLQKRSEQYQTMKRQDQSFSESDDLMTGQEAAKFTMPEALQSEPPTVFVNDLVDLSDSDVSTEQNQGESKKDS